MQFGVSKTTLGDHVAAGAFIRSRRLAKNLTLKDVAEEMGLSIPYLSDLERGRRNWTDGVFVKAKKAIMQASKK